MNIPSMDSLAAWLCSKTLSRFRRTPLRLTPNDLRNMRISFSQFGENLVIAGRLITIPPEKRGIYVDAGCFDPVRFSNTHLLNLMGWKGVNIDASESAIAAFNLSRPSDINICAALDESEGLDEFLSTPSGATNRLARAGDPLPDKFPVTQRKSVKTTTLRHLLDSSSFADLRIDLLDIDCEGADLAVLRGFDIRSRRPRIICMESHSNAKRAEIQTFLSDHGYDELGQLGPSTLFVDNSTGEC